MAMNSKANKHWFRWHLLIRLAGLTGLLAALAGLVLWSVDVTPAGVVLALAGGGLAAIALLTEIKGGVDLITGRRGAMGSTVAVQLVLAALLLAGVNFFSFHYYARCDCTRDQLFTIDPSVREQLAALHGDTSIVVLLRHVAFGQAKELRDDYDFAADRKVVEKVKDLVDQFQELGPRFKVTVLDVQKKDYKKKLADVTDGGKIKELQEAIEKTAENSIFFYANNKVQRLSFPDIFQLDKGASQKAEGGRGNLVLRSQGIGPFARRILNVDEKKPRIAVAVVHELLGLEGPGESAKIIGMRGVKKALAARGFETRDIVLKKWPEQAPVVLTADESRFEKLEAQRLELDESIKENAEELTELQSDLKFWKSATLAELNKKYIYLLTEGGFRLFPQSVYEKLKAQGKKIQTEIVDDDDRKRFLADIEPQVTLRQLAIDSAKNERAEVVAQQAKLNVEDLQEKRRLSDVKAKFDRMLADCDLLILPRLTILNAAENDVISNRVHRLDDAQLQGVKAFMKAGKPVLFCLGPAREPQGRPDFDEGSDPLENMLADIGFNLPNQTVLFDVESKAYGEKRGGLIFSGEEVQIPPVDFDWAPGQARTGYRQTEKRALHPIHASLRLIAAMVGGDKALDLQLRNPRPVYFKPADALHVEPTFMLSNVKAWNTEQPFALRPGDAPRFKPPAADDPDRGTVKERRRGQFPLAVAVETKLPTTWYLDDGAKPASTRLAVIGHGGVFLGTSLSPVREKLLLDVSNWLLGRDDLLAKDAETWQYPRVELTETENDLWQWGARLGLPLFFVYLGCAMVLVRRMR